MTGPAPTGTRPVGRLEVGRLGLGTAALAGLFAPVDEDQAWAALDEAWRAGIRFFDTAPHYGAGTAEARLGAFLADKRRDDVVVATKVGRLLEPAVRGVAAADEFAGTPDAVRRRDYSRDGVLRSVEASLRRTGLDRFDVLFVHDPDEHWEQASQEAVPALVELRDQGVIGAVGVGMVQAPMLARFVRETDVDCVLVAGRYTLLDQSAADELLPACADTGTACIVGGVLNSGVLAGPSADARFDYLPAPQDVIDQVRRLERVCERYGVPLTAAALQMPFRSAAVTSVLLGARSAGEVHESLAHVASPVPEEAWQALREAGVRLP